MLKRGGAAGPAAPYEGFELEKVPMVLADVTVDGLDVIAAQLHAASSISKLAGTGKMKGQEDAR